MQGINHVTIGVIIAVGLRQPAYVAPVALASHFILDMIPHYGNDPIYRRGTRGYNLRILVDGSASLLVAIAAMMLRPDLAGIIALGSFMAILPDFFWPLALYVKHTGLLWRFFTFHKQIQWSESRPGIFVEIVWLLLTGSTALYLLIN